MESKTKIVTEGTPNPNALKFVVEKTIVEKGSVNFPSKNACENSPLAKKIFEITSVEEVFFGKNFITITKNPSTNWDSIYDKIIELIKKHLDSNEPIITKVKKEESTVKNTNTIEEKIREILDDQIRPAVASDGGDVIFDSYQDGILRLHLQGACSSCPSSVMTLKAGIEQMLKRQIPELKEVISI